MKSSSNMSAAVTSGTNFRHSAAAAVLTGGVSHGNANHVQASLSAMTAHAHPPEAESRGDRPPATTGFPPIGALQSAPRRPGPLPTWVQVGP
jgi:hypothetical protein